MGFPLIFTSSGLHSLYLQSVSSVYTGCIFLWIYQCKTKQIKSKQKPTKYCLPWKRKIKVKFSTWWTSFPMASKARVHHGGKHSVSSFNSVSKFPKGKGCLNYELMPQEFSAFSKYLVALLSSSFISEHYVIRLPESWQAGLLWVKLLWLSFLAFHMANRD